jgi:5-methylcytosine-specific restriction endonuclease McrA
MRVLLLDSTFLPVKVITWQKAMILFVTGRAEVVEQYQSIDIRSTTQSFKLPKVLRLFDRFRFRKQVKFTRDNIFCRDAFKCQYCKIDFPRIDLTLDHVHPKSRGGTTSWENVVACCKKCNEKKADKLPRDFHLKLLKLPVKPSWSPMLHLRLKINDPEEWNNYFGFKLRPS